MFVTSDTVASQDKLVEKSVDLREESDSKFGL